MSAERFVRIEVPGCRIWSDGTIETVPARKMVETCRIMGADFEHNYSGYGDRPPPKHVVGKRSIAELEAIVSKAAPVSRAMDTDAPAVIRHNPGLSVANNC